MAVSHDSTAAIPLSLLEDIKTAAALGKSLLEYNEELEAKMENLIEQATKKDVLIEQLESSAKSIQFAQSSFKWKIKYLQQQIAEYSTSMLKSYTKIEMLEIMLADAHEVIDKLKENISTLIQQFNGNLLPSPVLLPNPLQNIMYTSEQQLRIANRELCEDVADLKTILIRQQQDIAELTKMNEFYASNFKSLSASGVSFQQVISCSPENPLFSLSSKTDTKNGKESKMLSFPNEDFIKRGIISENYHQPVSFIPNVVVLNNRTSKIFTGISLLQLVHTNNWYFWKKKCLKSVILQYDTERHQLCLKDIPNSINSSHQEVVRYETEKCKVHYSNTPYVYIYCIINFLFHPILNIVIFDAIRIISRKFPAKILLYNDGEEEEQPKETVEDKTKKGIHTGFKHPFIDLMSDKHSVCKLTVRNIHEFDSILSVISSLYYYC